MRRENLVNRWSRHTATSNRSSVSRRGLATKLLKHVLDTADKEGKLAYIEDTDAGFQLISDKVLLFDYLIRREEAFQRISQPLNTCVNKELHQCTASHMNHVSTKNRGV
jgi:hypothetical protein